LGDELPLILDGGRSPGSQPSTIIDLSVSPPRLLRLGPVSLATLREFLPDLVGDEVV
jgi:tRNA A37 threonylcarbamoyladenosine synthetase subunit TsaC/SUA5/YrdC